ncbi:hypothetical protein [uncultured Pelagimonas sp.]|uniref:hypothetical protein n=1 Tax=uncultured Pelagimonas sp. TaxID=1618102 RepID=UPI00260D7166|nr:hypothetical protein [uncultured Pelagimonas sp.]
MFNRTYQVDIVSHQDAAAEIKQFVTLARLAFETETRHVNVIDATDLAAVAALPFDVTEIPCVVVHKPGSPDLPAVRIGTCPEKMLSKWVDRLAQIGIFNPQTTF